MDVERETTYQRNKETRNREREIKIQFFELDQTYGNDQDQSQACLSDF